MYRQSNEPPASGSTVARAQGEQDEEGLNATLCLSPSARGDGLISGSHICRPAKIILEVGFPRLKACAAYPSRLVAIAVGLASRAQMAAFKNIAVYCVPSGGARRVSIEGGTLR